MTAPHPTRRRRWGSRLSAISGVAIISISACAAESTTKVTSPPTATVGASTSTTIASNVPTPSGVLQPTTVSGISTAPPAADGSADFEAAVVAYVHVFATGDTEGAWATVSERCQAVVPERQYKAAVASSGQRNPEMKADNVTVEIDGDQGRATYETGVATIGPYVQRPWRHEDGVWKWDDC